MPKYGAVKYGAAKYGSEYKTAIAANARTTRITGILTLADTTDVAITPSMVISGSLYLSEQCVTGESIEIGNVFASELGIELLTPSINPWNLEGAHLHLYFGIVTGYTEDEDPVEIWEDIPLGVFYIIDPERKILSTKIVALDGMILLDVSLGATNVTAQTPEQLITNACATAGVTLATIHATFEMYPNKALLLTLPVNSAVKTCRDLIMWACQANSTFARMSRAGALEIVPLHSASVRSITSTERYSPTVVSDLAIKITGLDMKIGETLYSAGTTDSIMALQGNPLFETLSAGAIDTALDAILADITQAEYTPFDISFIGDPTLRAGDYVTLNDTSSLGGDPVSLITHTTWHYRGKHSLKSVGKSGLIPTSVDQNKKKLTSLTADVAHIVDLIVTGRITVGSETTFSAGYDPITKRTVFTAQPVPPYRVGDLWLTSLTDFEGDMKKCIYQRLAGAYDAAHWVVALGPVEFAKLGTTIIEDGWIITDLLTADNIMAGNLVVGGSGHVGSISVLNAIGEQIATIDQNGINVNALVGATGFTGNNGMAAVTMEFIDAYAQMQLSDLYEDFYEPILFKAQHIRASYDTNGTTYWSTDASYLDIGNSLGGGILGVHILDVLFMSNTGVSVNVSGTEIMTLTDTGASFFGVPVVTSWAVAAWAPTLTGITIGNGTVVARSKQFGVLSYFELRIIFGSTTSVTGNVSFNIPSTAKDAHSIYGIIIDADVGYYSVVGLLSAASNGCTVTVLNASGTYLGTANLSSTIPMTWATGDEIHISGWYEH